MSQANPYDAFIMDHIRNARNYRVIADASHRADGINPLCGDELTVYVSVVAGRIEDVAFQCACCGISMASASVMTETLKSCSVAAAKPVVSAFVAALNGNVGASRDGDAAHLAILQSVRQMPGRNKCAALPWITLEAALDGRAQAVSA
jgi:nitrogen fixation protein NifU and related proteins